MDWIYNCSNRSHNHFPREKLTKNKETVVQLLALNNLGPTSRLDSKKFCQILEYALTRVSGCSVCQVVKMNKGLWTYIRGMWLDHAIIGSITIIKFLLACEEEQEKDGQILCCENCFCGNFFHFLA